jgi:hypothetical protein
VDDDKDQRRLQGIIPDLIVNGTVVRPAGKKGKVVCMAQSRL